MGLRSEDSTEGSVQDLTALKQLFWVYALMLIFEGVLRKWLLPSLSNPLLFLRDPVAIAIYLVAVQRGVFPARLLVLLCGGLGLAALALGLLLNPGEPMITIYGIKSNFLHLPLIFVGLQALTLGDVEKLGLLVHLSGMAMVPLMILQFRASPDSFWNAGAGGGVGAQITAGMGKIRPPGFFSFVTGAAQFSALHAAFVVYGFVKRDAYRATLVWASAAALVVNVGVSNSRLTVGYVATVLVTVPFLLAINPKFAGRIVWLLGAGGVVSMIASSLDIFHEGTAVLVARLQTTGDFDSGVLGTSVNWGTRVFQDVISAFAVMGDAPILGYGVGYGTNVGAKLVSGKMGFLIAEGEWARMILELGPLLGAIYLGFRTAILIVLLRVSLREARAGNALPLLVLAASAWTIFSGQFGQATSVGFAALGGALCLGASNIRSEVAAEAAPVVATGRVRGRSRYAEYLYR